ncbi:two-component sensor histidine kinase [Leptolyngbya sp. 'hensonii']|nr:two-component sensor histidine kinase [Leptolyngbya sp. 'hensonii']
MNKFRQVINQFGLKHCDPTSLQFRLTAEIAVLSVLSLSTVAVWMGWQMQQILMITHKQNIEQIADRFPRDVELYGEMFPLEIGLEKAVDNVSTSGVQVWVKSPEGKVLAQSARLQMAPAMANQLMALTTMPLQPQVYRIGERYIVLCEAPVIVKGMSLGRVYLVQDVTRDQLQLHLALQQLTLVCILVTTGGIVIIGLRVRRLLQPLQDMNRMAGAISVEDLKEAKLQLNHAPREVRELAQTFNMMLSRLADAWEQQRQFVSNVSHELRTPLTVVSGYLQSLLRRGTNLNDYQREALQTAASEADHTIRLLQDLLDLARADSGYMYYRLESILLNDLVLEVADMGERFSDRSITTVAPIEVRATVDRDRLKQVLINLIDNAVKYSGPDQPILLKLGQAEGQATIQVCDQGVGMALPDQSRIFERFYRVDEARSQQIGGHGLGLAIVKTLVEGMGGSITVRSRPSEGSTFTIAFPSDP